MDRTDLVAGGPVSRECARLARRAFEHCHNDSPKDGALLIRCATLLETIHCILDDANSVSAAAMPTAAPAPTPSLS